MVGGVIIRIMVRHSPVIIVGIGRYMICIGVGVGVGVGVEGWMIVVGWGRVRRHPVEILTTISHLLFMITSCRKVVVVWVSSLIVIPILLLEIVLARIFRRRLLVVFIIVVAHINYAKYRANL